MGLSFGCCLYFKYFFCMADVPDIYLGLTVDAGSKQTYEVKMSVIPPLWYSCAKPVQNSCVSSNRDGLKSDNNKRRIFSEVKY